MNESRTVRCRWLLVVSWAAWLLLPDGSALAQLRIVSYNTLGGPRAGTETILRAIGEETRNGIARPIDVLLLQEQNSPSSHTQQFVNLLNSMYAGQGITYARGSASGGPTQSSIRQTIVYNTQSVDLVAELAFGDTSGSTNLERQVLRYQLRPDGYGSTADFYAYNSHYKAGLDFPDPPGSDAAQRDAEATAIRANYDTLPAAAHAIYAGDHNFYYADSREPAVGTLTAAGPGQARDPLNRVGNWHDSFSFRDVHTQSPCTSNCVGATGGMDDRFDFQWVTSEFLDGEGLSYISGSYHAFGNNGTTFDNNINAASNTVTFPGVTSYNTSQILDALWASSDHLPVVADYQIPAALEAVAGNYPATFNLGQEFNFELTVSNAANVVAAIGADELDYSISWDFGDPFFEIGNDYFNQMDPALGGGNMHLIGFDTSTPGMKSGMIHVQSGSQGVKNPLVDIPISFEVLSAMVGLPGDYNDDGVVGAADYTVWRDHLGDGDESALSGNGDGMNGVDAGDYALWLDNFGEYDQGGGSLGGGRVPEPAAWLLAIVGGCLLPRRVATLKGWTRRK